MTLGKLMAENPDATLGRLAVLEGLFRWGIVYALGNWANQPNFLYYFSDGLMTMGLSVILIHVAYRLGSAPGSGRVLVRAGVYSYSLYLFHQPYVMYAGEAPSL